MAKVVFVELDIDSRFFLSSWKHVRFRFEHFKFLKGRHQACFCPKHAQLSQGGLLFATTAKTKLFGPNAPSADPGIQYLVRNKRFVLRIEYNKMVSSKRIRSIRKYPRTLILDHETTITYLLNFSFISSVYNLKFCRANFREENKYIKRDPVYLLISFVKYQSFVVYSRNGKNV